ncbi:MAG: hypothetical protein WBV55_16880 [Candidatus Sulfotelmatobacter sp.]
MFGRSLRSGGGVRLGVAGQGVCAGLRDAYVFNQYNCGSEGYGF